MYLLDATDERQIISITSEVRITKDSGKLCYAVTVSRVRTPRRRWLLLLLLLLLHPLRAANWHCTLQLVKRTAVGL